MPHTRPRLTRRKAHTKVITETFKMAQKRRSWCKRRADSARGGKPVSESSSQRHGAIGVKSIQPGDPQRQLLVRGLRREIHRRPPAPFVCRQVNGLQASMNFDLA